MNVQGNVYTFIYASLLVVVVAAILSFAAIKLQPIQADNIRIEKMQSILKSVYVQTTVDNATAKFREYIKSKYVINYKGTKTKDSAFAIDLKKQARILSDIKKLQESLEEQPENKKKIDNLQQKLRLPVYECSIKDTSLHIVPVRGKGLWGPIWGYIALLDDYNTVYGAFFDHAKETPGLGAEIQTPEFQRQFKGEKLFENNKFVSVKVTKGESKPADKHAVDGISGGTMTSKGVENMLIDFLGAYVPYFKEKQKK